MSEIEKTSKQTSFRVPTSLSAHPLTCDMPPYPIGALPGIIQNAVLSYQQYGQQPLPLIACSALSNVSLACQTLANVARDSLLTSPVSLYFLIIANSGERKSAADQTFGRGIREWEQKIVEELAPKIKIAHTLHHAWLMEKNALLSQIKRAAINDENTDWLKQKLAMQAAKEPNIPLLPMLFFEDTTQEGIISHLAQGWPSASLWSDEGSIVLSNQGMQTNATKFIATLNRLWDGKPLMTHRKTTHSISVVNRRLTVSLMLQPLVLSQLLSRNDGISRQSGFLARNLIAYPESSMGERYYQEPPSSLAALSALKQRLTDCLDTSLSLTLRGCDNVPTLTFSPAAKRTWISFFNTIENGLTNPSKWSSIKDFASKAAENMARLSALFHLVEGKENAIQTETVERAMQIIEWHLWETKRLLQPQQQPAQQQDAMRLLQWIKNRNLAETTPRHLQQYGPIRDKKRRDKAIAHLVETDHLKKTNIAGKTILLTNISGPKIMPNSSLER